MKTEESINLINSLSNATKPASGHEPEGKEIQLSSQVEKAEPVTNEMADHKSKEIVAPASKGEEVDQPATKTVYPELLEIQSDALDDDYLSLISDGTSVIEYTLMPNDKYSQEIISSAKNTYNLDKLNGLKDDFKAYLKEGRDQINSLFAGIHALNIHTEMFTVLFLIAMGVILKMLRGTFERPHDFAKWRDNIFGIRHRRLFQQAVQLEAMGNFSRKYSPFGKTRLLQLDYIRKTEQIPSCEDLLSECQSYDEIELSVLPDEAVERMDLEPFPDISYDLDNEHVKIFVNGVITFKRLRKLEMYYVDFDQAKYIAEYYQQAIPVQEAKSLKEYLDKYAEEERPDIFDSLVMDGMKAAPIGMGTKKSSFSLSKVVANFIEFCTNNDIEDDTWIETQKGLVNRESVLQALNYLNFITDKMGFNVTNDNENKKEDTNYDAISGS